jgi:hypothetical protein
MPNRWCSVREQLLLHVFYVVSGLWKELAVNVILCLSKNIMEIGPENDDGYLSKVRKNLIRTL